MPYTVDAGWNEPQAEAAFDSILAVGGEKIDLVFAHNDRMAAGAYRAAIKHGVEKDMLFVGVDALPGEGRGVDMVADGELDATFIYPTGGDKVVLHHFPQVCQRLGVPRLHLSLKELEACPQLRDRVELLGVSVHAPEEAVRAQALGADYVTAGHVFDTDCKKGLPGRGLDFLRAVCGSVDIPVYAIGGIGPDSLADVARTGAAGACLMSGLMTCPHPAETVGELLARLA